MDNILNSSYNHSGDSHTIEESNPINRAPENLISIDTSDDDIENGDVNQAHYNRYPSLFRNDNMYRSEEEFHVEINRLKAQSSNRFKNKWEEILQKYSLIDDEKESDELDLKSGEIIKDNGHLRSLGSGIGSNTNLKFDGDIWSVTYDLERDLHNKKVKEARLKQKKKELKLQLKAREIFHNTTLQSSPLKSDEFIRGNSLGPSSDDNLLSLNPSPTKKFKSSPTKSIRSSSPVKCDEVSLLTPTKRKSEKCYSSHNTSSFSTKLFFDEVSDTEHLAKNDSDNFAISPFISCKSLRDRSKQACSSKLDETSNTPTTGESEVDVETSETSDVSSADNKTTWKLELLPLLYKNSTVNNESENEADFSLDFDDQFLIVTDTSLFPRAQLSESIYECAVDYCNYCTGNKLLYQSHLLDNHTDILKALGYPVNCSATISESISEDTIGKITKHFPLIFEVPRLPLSKNSKPFDCRLALKNLKTCQKCFITKEDLKLHQDAYPSKCSSKKQVLICPMLGCGYMTDMGYLEWRSHFIERKHHIDPKYRLTLEERLNSVDEDEVENLSTLGFISNQIRIEEAREYKIPDTTKNASPKHKNVTEPATIHDTVKELNEMFSDSGSEFSFSEYLSDEKDISSPALGYMEHSEQSYVTNQPKFSIQFSVNEIDPDPLVEDTHTGHESIEELFED